MLDENLLATPKIVKLRITPRDIDIVVDDNYEGAPHNFEKIYGEDDPEFTFTVSSETPLMLGDDVSVFKETSLSRSAGEDVGLYDILIGNEFKINS